MDFLKGADGCEWVWVMGEHKNDLSIEEIIEQEAQKTALDQAEKEAQALRYAGVAVQHQWYCLVQSGLCSNPLWY